MWAVELVLTTLVRNSYAHGNGTAVFIKVAEYLDGLNDY
jgi:hypothetical protein